MLGRQRSERPSPTPSLRRYSPFEPPSNRKYPPFANSRSSRFAWLSALSPSLRIQTNGAPASSIPRNPAAATTTRATKVPPAPSLAGVFLTRPPAPDQEEES